MKIHLRADRANGAHTSFTVFMNGGNCGALTMREDEALFFHDLVMHSTYFLKTDERLTSGIWIKDKEEEDA